MGTSAWLPREQEQCLTQLKRLGVEAQPTRWTTTPVPTPVEIPGAVDSVEFERTRQGRRTICRV